MKKDIPKYILSRDYITSEIEGDLVLLNMDSDDDKLLKVRGDVRELLKLLDKPRSLEEIEKELSSRLENFKANKKSVELIQKSIETLIENNIVVQCI
ncbi:MAG: hypothetical protein VYA54_06790 [Bdellovibrionota bacterium]|nr:hypothetical protein [Bdellovibrionota bacterium]